jgi:ribA/ribD-fused uncharacterized protein
MKWIYNWFNNYELFDTPLEYKGVEFKTVENFFQAMKSEEVNAIENWKYIASLGPDGAKKAGRKLKLRPDWENVRLEIMEFALRHKFAPGTSWHQKLMQTGATEIIEWNNWGDRYWGRDTDGNGENHLGKLLMKLREEYRNDNPVV